MQQKEAGAKPPGVGTIKRRNRVLSALTVFNALDQVLEVKPSLVLAERFQGGDFHHGAAQAEDRAGSRPEMPKGAPC